MPDGRETVVIRYFKAKPDQFGAPIPGTEDEDIWIDVEMLIGFVTEHGSGADFKRRLWTLDQASTERTYVWKKIYKDDSSLDDWALVPLPEKAYFESGSGIDYRAFSLSFDNSPGNVGREAVTFRVFHAEFDSKGNVVKDLDSFIDSEVLATYVEEYGAGLQFHREIWTPDNIEIPVWRVGLKQYEYLVRELPGPPDSDTAFDGRRNPEKVQPSRREFIQKPKPEDIR